MSAGPGSPDRLREERRRHAPRLRELYTVIVAACRGIAGGSADRVLNSLQRAYHLLDDLEEQWGAPPSSLAQRKVNPMRTSEVLMRELDQLEGFDPLLVPGESTSQPLISVAVACQL
jgi:hypothetical protein